MAVRNARRRRSARPNAGDAHVMTPAARLELMPRALLCLCQALGGTAYAADSSEIWPELSA
jgi:hypothetical protein